MASDKALEGIELIDAISESSIISLIDWSIDSDSEVRFRAIERIGELYVKADLPELVINRLRSAMHDDDELVRCAVLEVFEYHSLVVEFDDVASMLMNDSSALVRGQSAILMGVIGDKRAVIFIRNELEKSDDVEKAPLFYGLHLLGEDEGVEGLLGLLSSPVYTARCAAANLLPGCVTKKNRAKMIAFLTNAGMSESTAAAKSSIQSALMLLSE